jgi:hypothetical protein
MTRSGTDHSVQRARMNYRLSLRNRAMLRLFELRATVRLRHAERARWHRIGVGTHLLRGLAALGGCHPQLAPMAAAEVTRR